MTKYQDVTTTKIEAMNHFVANLGVMNVKLHNIHWNVEGLLFLPIHKFTQEVYEEFFETFDDVAEQIKILGAVPYSTMKDYLNSASIEEEAPKAFSVEESLTILKSDLELLRSDARAARDLAEEDNDVTTVDMFEGIEASIAKHVWFVNAMLGPKS